jgi:uncharacterized membrane protein
MKLNKAVVAIVTLVLVFFILAGVFYPFMPEVMASHWNAKGEADGTMPRFWGFFLFLLVSLVIAVLLLVVSRVDFYRRLGQHPQPLIV